MKILHITNGYWGSGLYKKMIEGLSKYDIFQFVMVPIRNLSQTNKFNIERNNVKICYSYVIKSFLYRIFFSLKINKIIAQIHKNIDIKEYNLTHAHTLFSDGAVALHFKKNYNIPYIVAVRNTDVNIFLKYLWHLKPLGKKIILEASKLIFLSPSYKLKLQKNYPEISDKIEQKAIILPNGIDEFWINNISKTEKLLTDNKINIVYAGEFKRNKNIIGAVKAVEPLCVKYDITFNLVGEGLADEIKYVAELKNFVKDKNFVKILKTIPKEELIKIYNSSHIFLMPSLTESFGLVYAEAISQNLPVIYTEKEGFDNVFKEGEVGYNVKPLNINDITQKIQAIIDNYSNLQKNILAKATRFNWQQICHKYYEIYTEIISKNE